MKFFGLFRSFTKFEWFLWLGSLVTVVCAYAFSSDGEILSLVASLVGVTALIFVAKGKVLGQVLCVVFSVFYGIVSFFSRYYGEMITYLGMSAPIAVVSIVTWLKNPSRENSGEVKVNTLHGKEYFGLAIAGLAVTAAFYFLLKAFDTDRLAVSTLSVLTSFLAAYLTMRRIEYYALAYAANDVVLIVLWVLASLRVPGRLPMVSCFLAFLANDIYGFVNWLKMKKRQQSGSRFSLPEEGKAPQTAQGQ